ncbi:MAG: hypothetical protein M3R17_05285 [Bacteroidota bacterium]|nr:hypothetical protein [Bacteroidota bacterium]
MRKIFLFLFFVLAIVSCKKDDKPPELILKSGTGYISSDVTLPPGSVFLVRMQMTKGTDELSALYTEVAFDGSNAPQLVSRNYIAPADRDHFEKDITITTRTTPGTERWVFNVNDADGRITKKEIRVTVQ